MRDRANVFADKYSFIQPLREAGNSLRVIAQALNHQGFKTQRGKEWTPAGVRNVLVRLAEN
ncbi:recombinase family protein [Vibrio alginolyticus]|uniref:recombinase family protein n=1 Tax=Vibrio alginolyticus TaxID=663 RepID=UPI00215B834B|nr:recombinase family protein [Vibrio alginolyticus]MCR9586580.1 recombinase family protein [Vibrio alginolyticus]